MTTNKQPPTYQLNTQPTSSDHYDNYDNKQTMVTKVNIYKHTKKNTGDYIFSQSGPTKPPHLPTMHEELINIALSQEGTQETVTRKIRWWPVIVKNCSTLGALITFKVCYFCF